MWRWFHMWFIFLLSGRLSTLIMACVYVVSSAHKESSNVILAITSKRLIVSIFFDKLQFTAASSTAATSVCGIFFSLFFFFWRRRKNSMSSWTSEKQNNNQLKHVNCSHVMTDTIFFLSSLVLKRWEPFMSLFTNDYVNMNNN